MYGDDIDFMTEVVETFFSEIEQRLPLLREAVEHFQGPQVYALAHSCIGSAGCIGAEVFQQKARALEACGKNNDATGASGLLSDFELEVAELRTFFTDYLNRAD